MDVIPALHTSLHLCKILREYIKLKKKKKHCRRWWVKPHIKVNVRNKYSAFSTLFAYFKSQDHEEFHKVYRMTVKQFDELYEMIIYSLEKSDFLREPIDPKLKLAVTLHFLGHGDSVFTLSKIYFIGLSTLYEIISEVCEQIWNILSPIYLPERKVSDWIEIGERYKNRWHFPNCLGALDGKHIRISKPPRSGSAFFNYKKYYSFVLMAICDPEYRFTWIDIGDYGSLNDASVFNASGFGQELEAGRYPLPQAKPLPGMNEEIPYFFIGDEAFGLRSYLMRPYSKRCLKHDDQRLFNYRLSHARMTIEDAFGKLVTVWRILQTTLSFKLQTSIIIVKCWLCLHNFLLSKESQEPEENRKYATEKLMQKIRENYKCNQRSNEDFGRKEEVEDVDDDEEEEYGAGRNYDDDDNNDRGNRQERNKIARKVCSQSQKIRNILCAYFAKQNNLM